MRAYNECEVSTCRAEVGRKQRWMSLCAGLLFFAAFSCIAQDGSPPVSPGQVAPAGAAKQLESASGQSSTAQPTPNTENVRKKQIADESTQLLSMAIALKAEVDKTTKDTLSINVIRRADEIEKLAHRVKEKIKQSAGPG